MNQLKSTVAELKDTATPWTADAALAVFPALSALAERHGFRAALLGGALTRGLGRDLDLVMIPLRGACRSKIGFLAEFRGELVRDLQTDGGADHAHVMKDGMLYDFSFGVFWAPEVIEKRKAEAALRDGRQ